MVLSNRDRRPQLGRVSLIGLLLLLGGIQLASAQPVAAPATCAGAGECLCDNSFQDCRAPILQLISKETAGIDVSFWFMTDTRYSEAIIARWKAGVPVRVILDTQADSNYPAARAVRDRLTSVGIPIRDCVSSLGINHWKAIIFAGQNKVQFSGANYTDGSFTPSPYNDVYTRYVDEAIYFTNDPDVVQSFMRKFDDHWTDTSGAFANLANISGPLQRNYPTYSIHADMNFVPGQNYEDRLKYHIDRENVGIDAVIFRITSAKLPDALIARRAKGVPVRLITEERQYRNTTYLWHSYNVDRMYMAGIQIKIKDNYWWQDMHQKSVVLHSRGLATDPAPMAVFGSSNWTSSSASRQREHNYFTKKPWIITWFIEQFERKWNNRKEDGTPIGTNVYIPFTPLSPETPVNVAPANDAAGQNTTVTLKWEGGWWAHKYDIYLSTAPTFAAPYVADYVTSAATAGVKSAKESYAVSGLQPGTTYYWQIVGKTMANKTKTGPIWRFTTAGSAPPPTTSGNAEIRIRAIDVPASSIHGRWQASAVAGAADGVALCNANLGDAKQAVLASPSNYIDITVPAIDANRDYHVWFRMIATGNSYANDSVTAQWTSTPYPPGTTSGQSFILEQGSGAGVQGWGWTDAGWASLAPHLRFSTAGNQTLRIQQREDGVCFDQIVISAGQYLTTTPGLAKNDTTIVPRTGSVTEPEPAGTVAEVRIRAVDVPSSGLHGRWEPVSVTGAAEGVALCNANLGDAKQAVHASPSNYVDITVPAVDANRDYHVWFRMIATGNSYANDSVSAQWTNTSYPPGTTSGQSFILEQGSGAGVQGWGWTDAGWDSLAPHLRFSTAGTQTLRIQQREDGVCFDQIVISADEYLTTSPGLAKNDTTIVAP
jgi:phosphatidylserine/phosphatidylglycerophosphate/cardiolipin synthase-like enzyme